MFKQFNVSSSQIQTLNSVFSLNFMSPFAVTNCHSKWGREIVKFKEK